MDAYQEIHYLRDSCMDIVEYIGKRGTFTAGTINKRIDGVEDLVLAQVQDGKLLLMNKLKMNHQ